MQGKGARKGLDVKASCAVKLGQDHGRWDAHNAGSEAELVGILHTYSPGSASVAGRFCCSKMAGQLCSWCCRSNLENISRYFDLYL
jgi:hypothetical protein